MLEGILLQKSYSCAQLTHLDDSSEVSQMLDEKYRAVLLGLTFLILLMLSYIANTAFFNTLSALFQNQLLVFSMIFINNVIVVSLILLGMTFYVDLVVLGFFKREKYANVVLEHPRTFAVVFALIVLFLSILRGAHLFLGRIIVEALPIIFLVSTPVGIIEGYGIYLTIRKTLSRTMTVKDLVRIYGIFLIAALIEVCFINILR
ncbi:MAG: hypothetical protein ACETVP_00780 [Candidatus Bathyarchaeia archaeon]